MMHVFMLARTLCTNMVLTYDATCLINDARYDRYDTTTYSGVGSGGARGAGAPLNARNGGLCPPKNMPNCFITCPI